MSIIGYQFSLAGHVREYPAVWPLSLLAFFFPLVWLVTRRYPVFAALVIRRRVRWLGALGVVGVLLFATCTLTYLHCAAFWDFFECREASVAALLRRGGVVYPSFASPERYCSPYGPTLYLVLATSQTIFGATVFATKLPATLANLATFGVFWQIVRRQYASRTAAWALTGLLAAFLMALRQLPFWAKADPIVLCLVTAGLYAAFRPHWRWCVLLGFSAGLAAGCKPHALAYFLPALVIAWQTGWRVRRYAVCAGMSILTFVTPYLLARHCFSVENYVAYLFLTAREGTGLREISGFCRWVLLLTGFVVAFNRLTWHPRGLTADETWLRRAYLTALGLAILLIAWPASSIGAGQPHLLPLIPSFLLAAGDRYSNTLRVRWRTAPNPGWIALACSTVLACLCVALQTTGRMLHFHASRHQPALACIADANALLTKHASFVLLSGSGDGSDPLAEFNRHTLVLGGQPIGLDAAAMMDYQRGGLPTPDFDALLAEVGGHPSHREVLWLLPRGQVPFGLSNVYGGNFPVYSAEFRSGFLRRFERHDQSRFYDVYRARPTF